MDPVGIFDFLPKLKKEVSPPISALIGFFTGPIGLSVYFKSGIDFFFILIMQIFLLTSYGLLPNITEGEDKNLSTKTTWVVLATFQSAYGYLRARNSNERLKR